MQAARCQAGVRLLVLRRESRAESTLYALQIVLEIEKNFLSEERRKIASNITVRHWVHVVMRVSTAYLSRVPRGHRAAQGSVP